MPQGFSASLLCVQSVHPTNTPWDPLTYFLPTSWGRGLDREVGPPA